MDINNMKLGKLEKLEQEINRLPDESGDKYFDEYLRELKSRVAQQGSQLDMLQNEFNRNYDIYVRRIQEAQCLQEESPKSPNVQYWQEPADEKECDVRKKYGRRRRLPDTEFVVGASILGIIGGMFILVSLVMLGMNYMNGFIKEMCLYALCAAALSGAALVPFFSHRRSSPMYKLLGILAGYVCFMLLEGKMGEGEFLVASAILIILNLIYAIVQVKSSQAVTDALHIVLTAIFSLYYAFRAKYGFVGAEVTMIYLVCSGIVIHFILILRIKNQRVEADELAGRSLAYGGNAGIITAYAISAFFNAIAVNIVLTELDASYRPVTLAGLCIVAAVAFAVMTVMRLPEKCHIYCYISFMAFTIYFSELLNISYISDKRGMEAAACLVILMVLSKLFAFRGNINIRICDAALTFFTCLFLCIAAPPASYILLAGVFLGIICISRWKTYNEIVLTAALIIYASENMPSIIRLPSIVGILLAGMILFNNFKRMHDQYIVIYNALAIGTQAACFLLLLNPVYRNAYITYLCMLVFGTATIVLILQEKYNMHFKMKNLVLAVFLSYMGALFKSGVPVLNSIILMVLALACVGAGFVNRQKFLRIYGLVLALIICFKLALFDFADAFTLQKIILFFAAGVIALIIAGIYIILDKKKAASDSRENII
ncbi:MAG: hypothetical protein LUG83_10710 [Lachnospiraceae bacterium]|nr:hypothetical protein [Lachnospiraceae bacterium]